jgi:benzoyl-CoA reductase/2-hydroxyglutaryl-CoA dehydratase subunit BcrC/BadD/HgdB
MATDYTQMWTDLGLDLEAHDALLRALGQSYQDIYLAQKGRPKGMEYFDFVMSEVHGLRIRELLDAKAAGRPVIGSFCVFVPEELVLAVGGVSVGLCAGAEFAFDKVEEHLPRNTCALIKAFFGFGLAKVCPYIMAADLLVGENTCDGKKKAWEIAGDLLAPMHVVDLPQVKSAAGRGLLLSEYRRFAARLEELSGNRISTESLKEAIGIVNAKRAALARLARLRAARPSPISGLDALLVNQISFYDDPVRFTASVDALCDELEGRIAAGEGIAPAGAPRLLVSGCPMAVPNWKVPWIVETSGAVIVGEESCVGERGLRGAVAASAEDVGGLMEAIVDRYLTIDCAIFTPNPDRLGHVREIRDRVAADGVLHYSLQFCTPYQMEVGPVEKAVKGDGTPFLRLETDYSMEDVEQLRTRVEAFVELLESP